MELFFLTWYSVCLQLSRGIFTLVTPIIGPSYETLVSYSNTFQVSLINSLLFQSASIINIQPNEFTWKFHDNISIWRKGSNQKSLILMEIWNWRCFLYIDSFSSIAWSLIYLPSGWTHDDDKNNDDKDSDVSSFFLYLWFHLVSFRHRGKILPIQSVTFCLIHSWKTLMTGWRDEREKKKSSEQQHDKFWIEKVWKKLM